MVGLSSLLVVFTCFTKDQLVVSLADRENENWKVRIVEIGQSSLKYDCWQTDSPERVSIESYRVEIDISVVTIRLVAAAAIHTAHGQV